MRKGSTYAVRKGEGLSLWLVCRLLWNALVGLVRPGEDNCLVLIVSEANVREAKQMICRCANHSAQTPLHTPAYLSNTCAGGYSGYVLGGGESRQPYSKQLSTSGSLAVVSVGGWSRQVERICALVRSRGHPESQWLRRGFLV